MVYYVMKKRGFTLVELLAVIAILGILVTVISVAVLKIYNSSVEKTMEVQNKNVKRAAAAFLEDYCIDPVDGSFVCPETYENRYYNKFVCLGDLRKDTKNSYIEKVTYKGDECNGVIIFTADEEGELTIPNPYLYCKWNEKEEIYDYMTNPTLDVSDYEVCGIKQPKVEGELTAPDAVYCHFDGDLTQGAEFVKGSYTYRYKQELNIKDAGGRPMKSTFDKGNIKLLNSMDPWYFDSYYEKYWENISDDGWGVSYTGDYTKKTTDAMCTYINDKPVVSMSYTFLDVPLKNVALNKINTRNVKYMTFTFANSYGNKAEANYNTEPNITKLDTSSSIYPTGTLDLSNFDTRNVVDMSGMFYGNLYRKINISNFDTSKVEDMSFMFADTYFSSLNIAHFNTSNVYDMSGMFYEAGIDKTLDVSSFDTKNVEYMEGMFENFYGSINGIQKFNTSNVTDMSGMFSNYHGNKLDLSKFDTSEVYDMSSMFRGCDLKKFIGIENFDTSNVRYMGAMFANANLGDFDFNNFNTSKVVSMSSMFSGAKLSNVKNLESLDTKNVTYMSYMFSSASAAKIDLSKYDLSNVRSMESMFWYASIGEINIGNSNTGNVTNMSGMFNSAYSSKITIGTINTSNVTDMSYMFAYTKCTDINVSSFNTSKVTNMNSMFRYSKATTLDLSSFSIGNSTNLNFMFYTASATTGYVKDADTAAKFNDKNVTGKPDELTFTVK